MVTKFSDYIDKEKGKPFLIMGAGSTVKEYSDKIDGLIAKIDPIVIGINNMSAIQVPTYHLWTNSGRYKEFGQHMNESSTPMFGRNISKKLIKQHYSGDYIHVDYRDEKKYSIKYKHGVVFGYYRTAGCLAIMLAHLMGASDINVVGMDGYTLHSQEDIESGKHSQHCYGVGLTDKTSWEEGLRKDKLVNNVLKNISAAGIEFKIITNTVFKDFYDEAIL